MLGLRPFDVQLIGAMILHKGEIAEMRTGEGKTLVAVLPAYLNALSGKGVHVRSSAHPWSTSLSANAPAGAHHSSACSMLCMLADSWCTYGEICKPKSRASFRLCARLERCCASLAQSRAAAAGATGC